MFIPDWVSRASPHSPGALVGAALLELGAVVTAIPLFPNQISAASTLAAIWLATLATWYWNRRLPRFRRGEIGIIVSITWSGSLQGDPRVRGVIDRLVATLRLEADRMSQLPAGLSVRVIELTEHHAMRSDADLRRRLNETGATFGVWCDGAAGHIGGNPGVIWPEVHFGLRHRPLNAKEAAEFERHVELVVIEPRQYQILFSNDVADSGVVGRNLATVARYQIGLALAANGLRQPAIMMLKLCSNSSQDETARYRRAARELICFLLCAKWIPQSGEWLTYEHDSAILATVLCDANEARSWDPQSHIPYALSASINLLLGRPEDARYNNALMKARIPTSQHYLYHINDAAIKLYSSDFDGALDSYQRLKRGMKVPDPVLLKSGLEWLYSAVDHVGDRFSFGLAYLNDFFFDETVAASQYIAALPEMTNSPRARRFCEERVRRRSATVKEGPAA